jgi:hypothetical protein
MIPTVAEDRAQTLRARAQAWRADGLISAETEHEIREKFVTSWRSYGPFAALLFFFLTVCAVAAFHGVLDLANGPTVVAGIAALVIAEVLIAKKWFGTGVESALWISGLFSLIFSLPSQGRLEAILVFAAAAAIAGVRVRNPFFGALAAVFFVEYIYAKGWNDRALGLAAAIAGIALVALMREWRRPSTEGLWIALLLSMIPVAYVAGQLWQIVPMFLCSALVLIAAGLLMRHHAPLVAGAIALVIAVGDWIGRSDLAAEMLLAIAGALCLGVAFVLSRVLRDRTLGFVSTPMRLTSADDAIQLISVVAVAPHDTPDAAGGRVQGDGTFAGAGATGSLE